MTLESMIEGEPKARRLLSRRTLLAILVVAVISTSAQLALLFYVPLNIYPTEGDYEHYYLIEVETNNTQPYTLILPVPADTGGGLPFNFLEQLDIVAGSPVLALVSTEHGRAIEIYGAGFLKIEWKAQWPVSSGSRYGNMTMTTGAEGWNAQGPALTWVLSDCDSLHLRLFYESLHVYMHSPTFASGGGPEYSLWMYPSGDGWQQVEIEYGWAVIN